MKGVVLAGGYGTRLRPLTQVVSKQLLPVYDKPMIYYPLSTLIHAGVNDVLIICNPNQIKDFERLLFDGEQFGIKISYRTQEKPSGVAQGIQISEEFLEGESFWYILGDNLFHGPDFGAKLRQYSTSDKCHAFAYRVNNPSDYGVAIFDSENMVTDLVEKPKDFLSNWAIPGLYFFQNSAIPISKKLKVSPRGEFEIIDLLKEFLSFGQLVVGKISRGNAWFDMGTADSLLKSAMFVETIQTRQGMLVGSPEEAAYSSGLFTHKKLLEKAKNIRHSDYFKKLSALEISE